MAAYLFLYERRAVAHWAPREAPPLRYFFVFRMDLHLEGRLGPRIVFSVYIPRPFVGRAEVTYPRGRLRARFRLPFARRYPISHRAVHTRRHRERRKDDAAVRLSGVLESTGSYFLRGMGFAYRKIAPAGQLRAPSLHREKYFTGDNNGKSAIYGSGGPIAGISDALRQIRAIGKLGEIAMRLARR